MMKIQAAIVCFFSSQVSVSVHHVAGLGAGFDFLELLLGDFAELSQEWAAISSASSICLL